MTEDEKSVLIGCSTIAFAVVGVVLTILIFAHVIVWRPGPPPQQERCPCTQEGDSSTVGHFHVHINHASTMPPKNAPNPVKPPLPTETLPATLSAMREELQLLLDRYGADGGILIFNFDEQVRSVTKGLKYIDAVEALSIANHHIQIAVRGETAIEEV